MPELHETRKIHNEQEHLVMPERKVPTGATLSSHAEEWDHFINETNNNSPRLQCTESTIMIFLTQKHQFVVPLLEAFTG